MDSDNRLKLKNIIVENIFSKNRFLDLSFNCLEELPEELYEATHLEYLYLSNNNLKEIPVTVFHKLIKLKLLDLRFNSLTGIPGEISKLKSLEILLLDGNSLTSLPVEIGLLENIKGLNIGSNPLTYPSVDVIRSGYRTILQELNNKYNNQINGSSYYDQTNTEMTEKCDGDLMNENKSSEKLFKPKIYKEIHNSFLEKTRKSGLKPKQMISQSLKHENLVKLFPEPVSLENIERKMVEQLRLTKIKEVKLQREAILQNVKDKNAVNDWREEARDMQLSKRREQFNKLPLEIKLESDSRILEAPFQVDKESLEMINGDELNSMKQKSISKPPKPHPIDRETQLLIEAEKRNRQKTLHLQIKKHGDYLANKRNNPKGTVQEEVESAKRDLEIVLKLQKELQQNLSVT